MTLGELEQVIYDQLGSGGRDQVFNRRIRGRINMVHRELLSLKRIGPRLRFAYLPFTTVASSSYAVLPQAVAQLRGIVDVTNNQPLSEMSLGEQLEEDPGETFTGNPRRYSVLDMASPVALQPSAACELFLDSDSASDTAEAVVHGITSDGQQRIQRVIMTGTTEVSLSSSITTWIHVSNFYITASAVGHVILLQETGGTELSRISPGQTKPRYTLLRLFPSPSTAMTLYAAVLRRVDDMTEIFDEPMIPEDYHWVIESGVLLKEFSKKEKSSLYDREFARYRAGIAELRQFVSKQTAPTLEGKLQWSQLGPWFEAGT